MTPTTEHVMVVTGASSGIGEALAIEALKMGYRVVMAARRTDLMENMAMASGFPRDQYMIIQADVSVRDDCRRLIEESVNHFGRMDVLINNAGVSMRAMFEEVDLAVLEKLMQVNFWGTVYCSYYAMPHLLKNKGSLVGVSSIAGVKGLPSRTGYSASKFAMNGFLESLRIENMKKDLHVLIACPGFTASNIRKTALSKDGAPQEESPRNEEKMMSAEQVAIQILHAVKKRKHRLVMTRQGKMTVLLNKFLPTLVDKLVYRHLAKEVDSPLN